MWVDRGRCFQRSQYYCCYGREALQISMIRMIIDVHILNYIHQLLYKRAKIEFMIPFDTDTCI